MEAGDQGARPRYSQLGKGASRGARHVGRDIMAAFWNLVGWEVAEYSKLLADSRELAIQRMTERAEAMGANAVVGTRFITAGIMGGASEILAYGTPVEVKEEV